MTQTVGTRTHKRLAGNGRLLLLCLLLFSLSSLVSFWIFFPAEVLQQRLVREAEAQTGLQMQGESARMLFPFGLEMDLEITPEAAEIAPVRLTGAQLTPVWFSLFSGNPALDMQTGLAGGRVEMQADNAGRLELLLNAIEIEGLQQENNLYRARGILSGRFTGEGLSAAMTGSGEFSLQLQTVTLQGLQQLGLPNRFPLGQVTLEGKFDQRRLSLEKVLCRDGSLEVSGGGTLLIGETAERTRLNLNVRLLPTATTPAALRDLLSLTGVKPTADGSYLLRIGGSLGQPQLR